jgi:L-seryl-tRNA(Ser) seleniumtransferase
MTDASSGTGMPQDRRRALPSVGALLQTPGVAALLERAPRGLVVSAVRDTIDVARRDPRLAPGSDDAWLAAVERTLEESRRASLRPVLNATGVVLHTNLGRAPLADAALAAIARVASGYTNLEYDVESGERGSRYVHCAALLRELTGAEDALVVNNGAAALILALDTLAAGRESIVSRGELIEIGGSFRIPDIMAKSGTTLVEVGTTNRTTAADYAKAITTRTGAIVKVHRSNFAMDGFVAEASTQELAELSARANLPLIHDLGSGLLVPLDSIGLTGEPTAGDAIRAGASIVTMSGDKLLGGPQAGLLIGSKAWIGRARSNPLTRAMRVDKLTLAALEATLALYRDPPRAMREIPVLAQLGASLDQLRARASHIGTSLPMKANAKIIESTATVGGGAFPTARIPSIAIQLGGPSLRVGASSASELEAALRHGDPPVIARIMDDRVLVDLRTILPVEDEELRAALQVALG